MIYLKRHIFPVGIAFSGSEDANEANAKIMPKIFVQNKLRFDALERFKQRQKFAGKHLENPWALHVWDDCTDDTKLFKKPIIQDYYKNGRHWHMLHINSVQYCLDVPPAIRTCIDGSFILRESNDKTRRKLYENYASIIPTYNDFNDIMDEITTDFTSLYIDNRSISNNVEDCIYYYKANLERIPDNWRVGCDAYWDQTDIRFNPNYIEN